MADPWACSTSAPYRGYYQIGRGVAISVLSEARIWSLRVLWIGQSGARSGIPGLGYRRRFLYRGVYGSGQTQPRAPRRPSCAHDGCVSVRVFGSDKRVSSVYRCRTSVALHGQGQDGRRVSVRHTLGPTRTGRPKATVAQKAARQRCQWHHQHHRCVGCENQSRGTRSGTIKPRVKARGNRRRRDRRKGAATATEWRSLPKELRAAVRSTLPEATAVAPAVMRTPEQGGKWKPVTGEGRTGDAQAADTLV